MFDYYHRIKESRTRPLDVELFDNEVISYFHFRNNKPIDLFTTNEPHSTVRNFIFDLIDHMMMDLKWSLVKVLKLLEGNPDRYYSCKSGKTFKIPSIQQMIMRLRYIRDFKFYRVNNDLISKGIYQLDLPVELREYCLNFFK